MSITVVVGAQWGDEGKGKITDILAEKADLVVRYQGGNNAGHTVVIGEEEFKLHLIPSGILHPDCTCMMADGTLIDPQVLAEEIQQLQERGHGCENLRVSCNAHVIMPYHRLLDGLAEEARGSKSIGTTRRGIGPAYTDKTARMPRAVRFGDLSDAGRLRGLIVDQLAQKNVIIQELYEHSPLASEEVFDQVWTVAQTVSKYTADTHKIIQDAAQAGKQIVFEGAQGTFLDLDYGTYPFVTSSHPVAGGACLGTGVGPTAIDEVTLICKAYTTRVGAGILPTEAADEAAQQLRDRGAEYGTTTGRPRRCGWLDGVVLRSAALINGATSVALTKLDVLDTLPIIPVCVGYEIEGVLVDTVPAWADDLGKVRPVYEEMPGWQQALGQVRQWSELPPAARAYVEKVEALAGVPVSMISVGPRREQTIFID